MNEIWILTVEGVFLVKGRNALFITPSLPANQFRLGRTERVKIETPAGKTIEMDANFSALFEDPGLVMTIPNAQTGEIPVGSKIWILNKTLEQITHQKE